MAFSMLPLFLLGALAPSLVKEFAIALPVLGALAAAGSGVAAVLSLVMGQVVDAVGARRSAIVLFSVNAVVLGMFAVASHYPVLVMTVALGGLPRALANPATNKIIAASVPPERRGVLIGVKQSGVQLGAFAAGLPLAWLAEMSGWRAAVWVAAACAAVAAAASWTLPADPSPVRRPKLRVNKSADTAVWWLQGFSVLLGAGISAVNTYAVLYATQQLMVSAQLAGTLVAILGAAGIVGRIGWSRLVSRGRPAGKVLGPLGIGAVCSTAALLGAQYLGSAWAWVGVLGIGSFAVAANAVSMLAVLSLSPQARLGRNSALVSGGFFGGFAVGPPCFGLLVDVGGYQLGWSLVGLEFMGAAAVAFLWMRQAGEPDGGSHRPVVRDCPTRSASAPTAPASPFATSSRG
jgi:predicted MFS family arabinose efflux permease